MSGTGVTFQTPAEAFLIGRGYSADTLSQIAAGNPTPTLKYEGTAMPIGVYTTFVKVNQ